MRFLLKIGNRNTHYIEQISLYRKSLPLSRLLPLKPCHFKSRPSLANNDHLEHPVPGVPF